MLALYTQYFPKFCGTDGQIFLHISHSLSDFQNVQSHHCMLSTNALLSGEFLEIIMRDFFAKEVKLSDNAIIDIVDTSIQYKL